MTAPRPITAAIKELRRFADELRECHTINGEWPTEKMAERIEYLRVVKRINDAEQEWKDVRQKLLMLGLNESTPEERLHE